MQNRGNGKGGGLAAVGLDPEFFGVSPKVMRGDYLLAIAYLDPTCRAELEADFIAPTFKIDATFEVPSIADFGDLGLEVKPPEVVCYFVKVRPDVRKRFIIENSIEDPTAAEDEIVFQNTYRLNMEFYSSAGDKRAFVLSHGKDLLVLKLVGYGDDAVRYYKMEDATAHVWIGHHRYPTKGTVWHPGGAHPFIGLNEALVHNGDFANYSSMSTYLAQLNRHPLFLTDTEVAVLVFDLLYRVYDYPLEYVIEAMAPTTERDFAMLPKDKQDVYRMLQSVHIHGSPDGPWFFLIAQTAMKEDAYRLIGITDTSMLRPQVFALQEGEVKIGFAASEKQAIDAALESLSATDDRFWGRADRYWNARGGSHTDGGAFVFTAHPEGSKKDGTPFCADKFGRAIETNAQKRPPSKELERKDFDAESLVHTKGPEDLYDLVRRRLNTGWDYPDLAAFLSALAGGSKTDEERDRAIGALTLLIDRRYPSGDLKRSGVLSLLDDGLAEILGSLRQAPSSRYLWVGPDHMPLRAPDDDTVVAIDATGFEIEGEGAVSRAIVDLFRAGWSRFLVFNARGHRFIGCGLGVDTRKVRIDVYGSPGDYLGSGLDGVEIAVHGSAQDQLAQIMKSGKLVVHGDVGQTFGYGAKGGHMYVLGNAAGRPLINAVGAPRVVINGTALDYLAESFMAGDPLAGGGWVVINGVAYNEDGELADLVEPYPGGNLFSLASGGALYVRDPKKTLTDDQLNAGEFAMLGPRDWDAIKPHLMENERLFGITLERLLTVEGERQEPFEVYRKIQPTKHGAFTPEEAWFEGED
jgi:glutamate synthase domain-containing protein 3/glutamate synthase domain-containing protein 1